MNQISQNNFITLIEENETNNSNTNQENNNDNKINKDIEDNFILKGIEALENDEKEITIKKDSIIKDKENINHNNNDNSIINQNNDNRSSK